jgi:K+-sensing histidine kinase KdpD
MNRVLVIEDEDHLRNDIVETLRYEGFESFGAANGFVGIEKIKELNPDIVVCDVMMPGLDGYQVLDRLRKQPETETMPFIFLTALGDRSHQRQGMEGGADDYVPKPFQTVELVRAIKKQMEKRDARARQFEVRLKDIRDSIFQTLPHEIRTPLMSILGYAELLVEGPQYFQPDQVIQMADSIYKAGVRLHRLTENYLLASQFQVLALNPETVARLRQHVIDRPALMIEDCAVVKTREYKRDADLSLDMHGAPAGVSSEHLKKAGMELLDNACKFSASGTPIQVKTWVEDDCFKVTVTNEGKGMTEEEIGNIGLGVQFGRDLHEQQGNGLGLYICQQIAEIHGGSLSVASTPGGTTTVTMALPVVKE